jgi:ribosomal protein S18 acetylase RimI-like enzyme
MTTQSALIQRLDTYYDAVPRSGAEVEEVGPFTLFVARSGWPYYARPSRGSGVRITDADVSRVLARQRELDVPRAIEWVDEAMPELATVVEAAGAAVERCPLLVLQGEPRGSAGSARILGSDERDDLVASRAAISVAFSAGGTDVGTQDIEARDDARDSKFAQITEALVQRIRERSLIVAAAYVPGSPETGPVGGGSYSPVGEVAEIAGVGILPAYRRRGLAGQLTNLLSADALSHGVSTVFCSAQSEDVARVYADIGFVRVGTACIASADGGEAE